MQTTNATADKRTARNCPDSLALIRQVERNRSTVRRVRELLEGTRDASELKLGDWFTTIEYVREETGVELVLYCEHRYTDAPDEARITSLGDDGLWCIVAGWSERAGYTRDKIAKFDIEESFRFAQSGDSVPELLTLEDAKARVKAFAEAR